MTRATRAQRLIDALTKQVAALTADRDTARAALAPLTADLAAARADLADAVAALTDWEDFAAHVLPADVLASVNAA